MQLNNGLHWFKAFVLRAFSYDMGLKGAIKFMLRYDHVFFAYGFVIVRAQNKTTTQVHGF